jgi:integrase
MSPRSRHPRNKLLPSGLRVTPDGYFIYTSPLDGREKGLGRDRAKAIKWAMDCNAKARQLKGELTPEQWLMGATPKTWGAWLDRYEQILAKRPLSPVTRTNYASRMRKARKAWPAERAFSSIDVEAVAEELRKLTEAGYERAAHEYRVWLVDCFKEAIADGWTKENPAESTRKIPRSTNRARLELDVLMRVYRSDIAPWLRNAIALALVTGQRREDVARAQRRDIRDGHWWVEQHKTANYKTPARIAIPLGLRLDVFGMTLGEVVEQCKSTGILSPYLVHQTGNFSHSRRGQPLNLVTITNAFSDAVDALGIDWGTRTRPTFHEIRSLSKRLYEAQGGVDTKQLLGHKSTASADRYSDKRGEWLMVRVK